MTYTVVILDIPPEAMAAVKKAFIDAAAGDPHYMSRLTTDEDGEMLDLTHIALRADPDAKPAKEKKHVE